MGGGKMFNRVQMFLGRAFTLEAEDLKREDGQTVTEYAVVLGVLLVGLASIVLVLKTGISDFLNKVSAALSALLP
jgi:Flp pilus assembly pilin Flp